MAIRMKQPDFQGVTRISRDEYEAARTYGVPKIITPYGFLAHNVIGRHEPTGRTQHTAYLSFSGSYFKMLEPLTDMQFQDMKLHQVLVDGDNRLEPVSRVQKKRA